MSDYQRIEIGSVDEWRDFHGGFAENTMRDGRRVLDHELPMQFVGVTANALVPGEEAGYWHAHSSDEEPIPLFGGQGSDGAR
ncbi:hypothetical protein GCM10025876_20910 [Demequina litorisediminis]|uniref:Cupin domain-containing protein n=1 Tax=Demequina litorisediminis TaxID=1849022 RepID=A0ABQ6IGM4_9MICO|nr:hypothetical protein GCM10025876_20910 [Demequina litorisediminis]